MSPLLMGTVISFDEQRGLGELRSDDGMIFAFHCTQIDDGSRTIDVGRRVRFVTLPKLGRWEAASLVDVE